MKSIKSKPNCYFTPSTVADLVFLMIRIFGKSSNTIDFFNIYTENFIKSLKDKYRFAGEIISSLSGYEMLEFLLLNNDFNDIEEYESYIFDMDDVDFFYHFLGEYISRDLIKSAKQEEDGLNKLYTKHDYICTNYLALRSLFYNRKLFVTEFFSCMKELYNAEFIKEYENLKQKIDEEYENVENALMNIEPLEFSESIMGKIFKNRGPYKNFIFIPSYFIPKKAVRFFGKDQILIYSPDFKQFTQNDIIKILKIISDETRFKIIELLSENKSMMGKDLAGILKLSTPTISHHMELLKEAGFINEERVKNSKFYSINFDSVNKFINYLSSKLMKS
jgi:DNA-binding transcriptional ArsR family regulator